MKKLIYIPSYHSFSAEHMQTLAYFCYQEEIKLELHIIVHVQISCSAQDYVKWLRENECQRWAYKLTSEYLSQAEFDQTCAYTGAVLDLLEDDDVEYIVFDSSIKQHLLKLMAAKRHKSKLLNYKVVSKACSLIQQLGY